MSDKKCVECGEEYEDNGLVICQDCFGEALDQKLNEEIHRECHRRRRMSPEERSAFRHFMGE